MTLGQEEVKIQQVGSIGSYECCRPSVLGPHLCEWTRSMRKKEGKQKGKDSLEEN